MADVNAVDNGGCYIQMTLALFKDGLCVAVEGQPAVDGDPEVLIAANPFYSLYIEC